MLPCRDSFVAHYGYTMSDCEPTGTMGKRSFCRVKNMSGCLGPRHFARPFSICATHRWTMFGRVRKMFGSGWIFLKKPCKTWFLWVDLGIKDRQTIRIFRIFVCAKK